MARKTRILTVTTDGRDKGKSFLITEFPPRKAERWAIHALSSIARNGRDSLDRETLDAIRDSGMAAIAALGIKAITAMPVEDMDPLLDEMLEAVDFVPDASKIDKGTMLPFSRPLDDEDVEEPGTFMTLRDAVFELHTDFSAAAFLSQLGSMAKAAMTSSDTLTSPSSSETS